MMMYVLFLTSALAVMVSGQPPYPTLPALPPGFPPISPEDPFDPVDPYPGFPGDPDPGYPDPYPGPPMKEPFENPGEIVPDSGLTIGFLMNALGGIWQQPTVIQSLSYACTDVLPALGSMFPEVDASSLIWGHICDKAIEGAKDLDAFDADGFCIDIINTTMGLMMPHESDDHESYRYRRQANPGLNSSGYMGVMGMMDDQLDILGILNNVTKKLYGIDFLMIINNPYASYGICGSIKQHFLAPSLEGLITGFAAELIGELLPAAEPILCTGWDSFIQSLGIESSSPIHDIIENAVLIGSNMAGYPDRATLCEALQNAVAVQGDNNFARSEFARDIISEILSIPGNAESCSTLGRDVINEIIEPVINLEESPANHIVISDDDIHDFTGYQGVDSVCNSMETAFTTVVDLPGPYPSKIIPGTDLTVDFFITALGGIWQQDRLIDSLVYICDNVIPELDSKVPDVHYYFQEHWDYETVCGPIRTAANDLDAFDATEFCTDTTDMFNDLLSSDMAVRYRRQVESMEDPMDILNVLQDVTGMDDLTDTCTEVVQFLSMSIPDILVEYGGAFIAELLPQSQAICDGWEATLGAFNLPPKYNKIIEDGVQIASEVVGFESREDMCKAIGEVLAVTGEVGAQRRKDFSENLIRTSFEIYTNNDRCSMYFGDTIDYIVNPLLKDLPGFPLQISHYTIYRYTGYMGVEGVCRAMETAFNKLESRIVTLILTGESLNGEPLVYTNELQDRNSDKFKHYEKIMCGIATNHVKQGVSDGLRSIDCIATRMRLGSVIVDLQIHIHALDESTADALAADVEELSSGETMTLSGDGHVLTVSHFGAKAEPKDGDGILHGLSTGAIVGIVIGAVVALMLVVFLITCLVVHSGKKAQKDSERGIGLQNPGYTHEKKGYGN